MPFLYRTAFIGVALTLYLVSNNSSFLLSNIAKAESHHQSEPQTECLEDASYAIEGEQFAEQAQWLLSIEAFQRALLACEDSAEYFFGLATSLVERAKEAPTSAYARNFEAGAFDGITLDDVLELPMEQLAEMYDVELLAVAEMLLLEAQQLDAESVRYALELARMHRAWSDLLDDPDQQQEQIESSIEWYDQALKMSPDDPSIWNEKVDLYLSIGEETLALEAYEESLVRDPLNGETYWMIATYHFHQADYQAVVDLVEPAIIKLEKADQTDHLHILLNFLAAAQVQLGEREEALAAFERMESLNPFDIGTITKIFILSKDLGKLDYDPVLQRLERATFFLDQATPGERFAYHRLLAELYENADPRPIEPVKYEKFIDLALSLISEEQVEQLIQAGDESGTTFAQHAKLREQALCVPTACEPEFVYYSKFPEQAVAYKEERDLTCLAFVHFTDFPAEPISRQSESQSDSSTIEGAEDTEDMEDMEEERPYSSLPVCMYSVEDPEGRPTCSELAEQPDYLPAREELSTTFMCEPTFIIDEISVEVVAQVNGTDIDAEMFKKRSKLHRVRLETQLENYARYGEQVGGQNSFANQLQPLSDNLSDEQWLAEEVLDLLVRERILAQEATRLKIAVSAEEVDAVLQEEVAVENDMMTEAQATAMTTPSATETAIEAETESGAGGGLATPTPIAATIPRPIMNEEQYDALKAEHVGQISDASGISLQEYQQIIRAILLEEKVEAEIVDQLVESTKEQRRVRHILIRVNDSRTEDEALVLAEEIYTKLDDGEDFTELAARYSDDVTTAENAGELGWFGRNVMVPEFEEAVFGMETGEISPVIETVFGYHIVELIAIDAARPIDDFTLELERAEAYESWLDDKIAVANIEQNVQFASALPPLVEIVPELGETIYPSQGNAHIQYGTRTPVKYNSTPPTSGHHYDPLAPWQIHDEPLRYELLVHNLEDGGVVIYYQCASACPELVEQLSYTVQPYIDDGRHVVLLPNDPTWTIDNSSPLHEDIDATIALTAWQRLLKLDEFDFDAINAFIQKYEGIDHHARN